MRTSASVLALMLALVAVSGPFRPTNTSDGDREALTLLRQFLFQHRVPQKQGYGLRVTLTCSLDQRCFKAPFVNDDYLKYPMRVACYGPRCYWINLAKRTVTPR